MLMPYSLANALTESLSIGRVEADTGDIQAAFQSALCLAGELSGVPAVVTHESALDAHLTCLLCEGRVLCIVVHNDEDDVGVLCLDVGQLCAEINVAFLALLISDNVRALGVDSISDEGADGLGVGVAGYGEESCVLDAELGQRRSYR